LRTGVGDPFSLNEEVVVRVVDPKAHGYSRFASTCGKETRRFDISPSPVEGKRDKGQHGLTEYHEHGMLHVKNPYKSYSKTTPRRQGGRKVSRGSINGPKESQDSRMSATGRGGPPTQPERPTHLVQTDAGDARDAKERSGPLPALAPKYHLTRLSLSLSLSHPSRRGQLFLPPSPNGDKDGGSCYYHRVASTRARARARPLHASSRPGLTSTRDCGARVPRRPFAAFFFCFFLQRGRPLTSAADEKDGCMEDVCGRGGWRLGRHLWRQAERRLVGEGGRLRRWERPCTISDHTLRPGFWMHSLVIRV
jgi:hypothetical protein